ncbi:MAG: sugar ABC transporter permease [Desulfobacterales bacterium]|nr:sugar ABC transporter permease [Desulfobacterales bacterium]
MYKQGEKSVKWVMLAPTMLILAGTTLYPFIYSFITSFRQWKLSRSPVPERFVGLDNYIRAFTDEGFWNSVWVTGLFTVISVVLSMVIGLGIALVLERATKLNTLMKSLLIFPFAMAPALKGYSWRFMLNPEYGVIDAMLDKVFPFWADVVWLAEPYWALFWLAMTEIWGWAPYIALVFIGALGSLPRETLAAARVDGANTFQVFWYITLPLLKPILIMVGLLKTIYSVKVFDQVVTLTGGGPGRATETMNFYVYKAGFNFYDMGYASALAYLMVTTMFVFAFFYVRYLMKGEKS